MPPVRFVGIDPGLQITGYACIELDGGGESLIVEAGIVRLNARASMEDRLLQLHADLSELFAACRPSIRTPPWYRASTSPKAKRPG